MKKIYCKLCGNVLEAQEDIKVPFVERYIRQGTHVEAKGLTKEKVYRKIEICHIPLKVSTLKEPAPMAELGSVYAIQISHFQPV